MKYYDHSPRVDIIKNSFTETKKTKYPFFLQGNKKLIELSTTALAKKFFKVFLDNS